MRLTDISIKALQAPEKGAEIHYDDSLGGFGVRISEGGTKSFVLTHGARRQRETIGRVGIISLSQARAEAKHRLAEYTLGKNQPRAVAWNTALDEYLAEVKTKRRASTHYEYERVIKKHFRFGVTRMTEIGAADLLKDLDKLKNTPSEHHHAYITLRAFIRWAHRKHYLDRNPMERMKPPQSSKPRERVLTDEELKRVWIAAPDNTFGRIVKLLILTGQRVGEISKLTAHMIGEETITLPSGLTKNGRQHSFPIGPLGQSALPQRLPGANKAFLFPALNSKSPPTPFNGFSKCKAKLDQQSGVADWTLHDIRRTFASGLASLGVSLPVIERLLNHVSGSFGGIVGVYQRYDFMTEMRAAIVKWEHHIQKLLQT